MTELELKEKQFSLDKERFEFEQIQLQKENKIITKHFATILTVLISAATITVSAVQMRIAQIGKDKELELITKQKEKELELAKEQKNREHSIELAKFITTNKGIITGSPKEQELFRSTLLAAYPDFSAKVFATLEQSSADSKSKATWQVGKDLADLKSLVNANMNYYADNTVDGQEFDTIRKRLININFDKLDAQHYKNAVSWFSSRPTVLYYSDSRHEDALRLSGYMKSITGLNFIVAKGHSFKEMTGLEDITFFIHHTLKTPK